MDNKELKIKLRVLEKLILTGLTEKDLSKFGAKEFFELYRKNKFSDRDGEVLLEIIEAIKNKKLFSYLEVICDPTADDSSAGASGGENYVGAKY